MVSLLCSSFSLFVVLNLLQPIIRSPTGRRVVVISFYVAMIPQMSSYTVLASFCKDDFLFQQLPNCPVFKLVDGWPIFEIPTYLRNFQIGE